MSLSLQRLAAKTTTIGSIMLTLACSGSPSREQALPASGVYAPPARLESADLAGAASEQVTARASLSLEELFGYAEHHAPAVLTAMARAQLSEADRIEASFTFPSNPALSLGAGVRQSQGSAGFDYEVALSQTLEVSGQQDARRAAAEATRELAHSVVDQVRWLTHVEVHRLAWLWLVLREQRERAQLLIDFSTSLTAITRAQIQAGEISPLDLLVVKADLAMARTHLIEVSQQEAVIKTRLAAVIGWPDATLPELKGALPAPRQPLPDEELLTQLATHHPSVRQRELAVEAERARLALAEREGAIKPSLGVSYSRESSPGASRAQAARVGMLSVSIPLALWRTNQEGRAQAQASLELADRERTQSMRELQSELQVASASVSAALAILELYTSDIIPELHTHFELLERAYELGEVDIHQVSQTRQRLLDVMTQHTQARVLYFERAATLEGLVGTEQWGTPLEHHTP